MSDSPRRLAPPDRRSPRLIRVDTCPVGASCYCCPLAGEKWHSVSRSSRTCDQRHPPRDKTCNPPYPKNIPPCPERQTLPEAPAPPPGFRPLRYEMCFECGRITARRWTSPDGVVLPWCAGLIPKHEVI